MLSLLKISLLNNGVTTSMTMNYKEAHSLTTIHHNKD